MTILVTGATGTVGRHAVEHLVRAGQRVRALTRNPARANLPEGVEVVAGNLAEPATLGAALDGVTGLHLISFDASERGHEPLETGAEIVELARKAGVRRVTVLRGGEETSVEQVVAASDLEWTFIQPVEFMSNALDWVESIRTEGVVREAFGDRRSAMVHESDIGAVVATVLAETGPGSPGRPGSSGGHGGQTYTLTGPEVLTVPQKLRTIGDAIGRELRFIELTEAQAREKWRQEGFPEDVIEFFVWAHGNTPEIGYTVVPTVEQVTGRPARTFAQWAAEHADAFRS